jgi:CheY-like chemotaxis protein
MSLACTGGYVLVIDDSSDIRETLTAIIDDFGHGVRAVSDGRAALHLLEATPPPSIILLDWMMPIMDGAAFLEEKRLRPAFAEIPVYLMTASAQVDLRLPGTVTTLRKPFGLDDVMSIVERHC